jgi:Arc/MetJ family transcription regulator
MRTTLTLDDDVVAEVNRLRRAEGIGISEAVNRLARSGLVGQRVPERYVHRSASVGLKIDVADIGAVLDLLDET